MNRPTPPKAGDVDPIKLFVIILGAASALIAGWCYFFLSSDLEDLQRANAAAQTSMNRIRSMTAQCDEYLTHFRSAREGSDGASTGLFETIRTNVGINLDDMTIRADQDSGSSRDYTQIVTTITIKAATWQQICEYMRQVESLSPQYRILDISGLRRIDHRSDDDKWRAVIKAAYRTQKR